MKTFTINGLSELLERDRGVIVRCLRGVSPDATEKGRPRYRMATAVAALNAHQGITNRSDGPEREKLRLADDLETCFNAWDAGMARLAKEPDIEKRRALDLKLKVGRLIGKMDRILKQTNRDNDIAMSLLHDELMGQTISKYLAMLDWEIVRDSFTGEVTALA